MGMQGLGASGLGGIGSLGHQSLGTSRLRDRRAWDAGLGDVRAGGHQSLGMQVSGTLGFGDVRAWGHWVSEVSRLGDSRGQRQGAQGHWGLGTCHGSGPCPHSGCFREYFVHKFRAMLGKNRVIFPGEKVLGGHTDAGGTRAAAVGLVTVPPVLAGAAGTVGGASLQRHAPAGPGGESGGIGGGSGKGHGSPTSLTLRLCQGLSRETAKRLRFVPGLIYVDGKD